MQRRIVITWIVTVLVAMGCRRVPGGQAAAQEGLAGATLRVRTIALASGISGLDYSDTLTAVGGVAPFTWSLASGAKLPAGLTLAASGRIAGQPTTPGTFDVSVRVRDQHGDTCEASVAVAIQRVPASAFGVSRTRGVAPLAVMFDAQPLFGNEASAFHRLSYAWDFADPQAGKWQWSGRTKNEAHGPVAAHVFERPGTYRVRLRVGYAADAPLERDVTITVDDPDHVFAAERTVCASVSGSFAGCPAGARHVTTADTADAFAAIGSGVRLLFRRGERWHGRRSGVIAADGPGLIGAFGEGVAPSIDIPGGGLQLSSESAQLRDWRVQDLSFVGNGGKMIVAEGRVRSLLVQRVTGSNFDEGIQFSDSIVRYHHQPMHSDVMVVDCDVRDLNHGGYAFFGAAERLALLGNRFVDARDGEHILRIEYMSPGVVAHNHLEDAARSKHELKIVGQAHAPGVKPTAGFVVADNTIVGGANPWSAAIGNGSAGHDERVSTGLVERNVFRVGPGTEVHLALFADDMTVRNNVFDMSGRVDTGVHATRRGNEPAHRHVLIYNNTCVRRTSADKTTCVSVGEDVSASSAWNNLLFAPQVAEAVVFDPGAARDAFTTAGNQRVSNDPFVRAPNTFDVGALHLTSRMAPQLMGGCIGFGALDFDVQTAGDTTTMGRGCRPIGALGVEGTPAH